MKFSFRKRITGVHVVPVKGRSCRRWYVKVEGRDKPHAGPFETQLLAFAEGRALARKAKCELHVHGVDGKIVRRNSYGNDPSPPKG